MKPNYQFLMMLLAIALVSVATPMCHAWQETQVSPEAQSPSGDSMMNADAKAFMEIQAQIRANQNRVDQLLRTLPIGFPKRRQLFKDEIDMLTKANVELKKEVFSKAKAAFKSSERPTTQSMQIVEKRLASMLSPSGSDDIFNPGASLELIAILREKFPEKPALLKYEFLANYAVERFENADKALRRLESVTGSDFANAKQELSATMEKYQQELMIRRLESNTDDLPRVLLVTTEGDIMIELFENHAPNTVANFIHLVRDQKFYDGKLFHLVKAGEYAMSGSPSGDGTGDAGYRIPCECDDEVIRSHFRGTLSMMSPEKDRGGSQFFITMQPNPHTFDRKYTAFGRVIEGMDVVLKLQYADRTSSMASSADVSKITRAEVIRARSHTYMPEKIAKKDRGFSGSGRKSSAMGSGSKTGAEDGEDTETPGSFGLLLESNGGDK